MRVVTAALSLAATLAWSARAQTPEPPEPPGPPERIVVTGSYLGAEAGAPATRLDRARLDATGAEDLTLALVGLPANVGAEFNTDSATQNDTSGTANVNLRGLGLDATLVLLDGARMTVSSVNADDGATFVDLNALVPAIAIESVDVLADGGSALYGSDALAGVVNVRTRAGFEGLEARVERRVATDYGDDASDWTLAAIAGVARERWRLAGALSWLDRTSLEGVDAPFALNSGLSSLGQPGAYRVPTADGLSPTIIDRDCANVEGGDPLVLGEDIAGLGTPGVCRLDFARFFSLVNNETRAQGWADGAVELGGATLSGQLVIADNAIERGNSPSLPDLSFPTIPAANPGNYFGEDVIWFGRPLGASAGSARRTFDHLTWRALVRLDAETRAFGRAWDVAATAGYSRNEVETTITDALADRFHAALEGYGGPDCPADAAAQGVAPGEAGAGCHWFNPFGSGALITDPADPRYNAPAVIADFTGLDLRTSDTDLGAFELVVSTDDIAGLPAGPIGLALGAQARRETTATDHGDDYNAENFLFILGGPDFSGARDAAAVFAEAALPVAANLDLQLALRHDAYETVSATSPRAALSWRPIDALSVRASASRSFRAPSLFETVSAATTLEQLVIGSQSLFRAVTTEGSADLAPETSVALTLGARWESARFRASLDYWRYDVEDLIVEESAQAIVDADLADGVFDDPRIELSDTGEVRRVRAAFVNAPSVITDGLDFTAGYSTEALGGALDLDASATWLLSYDLTDPVTGARVNAAGRRNFTNFARSLPRLRAQARARWTRGGFAGVLAARHISSYRDDENDAEVDAWTVVDAQASFALFDRRTTATLGALNLFGEDPPYVATPLGYDAKLADPRGRVAYLRLTQRF